jgi:mevalonate kinase
MKQEAASVILPRRAEGSACGKVIIVGEHAVVYGARAVAVPLKSMRMDLELIPNNIGSEISLKLSGKELSHRISDVVKDALQVLKLGQVPVTIRGKSSLPIGAGLGASATLCIAVLRTIAKSVGIDLDRGTLSKLGNILEKRFHGSPSGLDTAVVAYEECICFQKDGPVDPVIIPESNDPDKRWHFALIDSQVRASTLSMIQLAKPYFTSKKAQERIARFDALSQAVINGLKNYDFPTVAEVLNEASHLLAAAGVVTKQLGEIISDCVKQGALAAKPTGAGGGGVVLALLDPKNAMEQLERMKQRYGFGNVFSVTV